MAAARERGIRILTMDGGGTRGIVLIKMLEAIEQTMGRPILECFDLIGGTSTGGIVALGLAKGVTLAQMEAFYEKIVKDVFGYRFGYYSVGSWSAIFGDGSWYSSKRLEQCFKARLGGSVMANLKPKVFVVSANASVSGGSSLKQLFTSYKGVHDGTRAPVDAPEKKIDSSKALPCGCAFAHNIATNDVTVVEAALATSAAPTYFSEAKNKHGSFVDGGVVANNPIDVGFMEAKTLWPKRQISCMVSLGTGHHALQIKGSKSTNATLAWAGEIIDIATRAEACHQEFLTNLNAHHATDIKVVRFNPPAPVGDYRLDTADQATLNHMVHVTTRYLADAKTLEDMNSLKRYLI